MRRITVALLILALAAGLLISGCTKTSKVNRMMKGTWVSPEREYTTNPDGSVFYVIREYTFTHDAFRLVKTVYGDPMSDIRFYASTVDGTYSIVGESDAVPGAFDIDFTFAKLTMVPYSQAFVDIFMRSDCGNGMWGIDNPQDVSKTGCLSLLSIEAYPVEKDIIKVEGDYLQLGMRPKNENREAYEKRPTELSTKALMRQTEE